MILMLNSGLKKTKKRISLFTPSRQKVSLVIILGLVFILFAGFVTGMNQWTLKYVACGGTPVVITHQIASPLSERLYPGDKSYGPDFYNTYECMSAAKKAGKRF